MLDHMRLAGEGDLVKSKHECHCNMVRNLLHLFQIHSYFICILFELACNLLDIGGMVKNHSMLITQLSIMFFSYMKLFS